MRTRSALAVGFIVANLCGCYNFYLLFIVVPIPPPPLSAAPQPHSETPRSDTPLSRQSEKNLPLPACTARQLETIYQRLPDYVYFLKNATRSACRNSPKPGANRCPISLNTGCPETTWLDDHYHQYDDSVPDKDFLAINVGCNKGYDAVNFLRMGSNNASIARNLWREAMPFGMSAGVCGQENDSGGQYHVSTSRQNKNALVYCVEPMPSTFVALKDAAKTTGWGHQLKLLQLAINNEDPSTVGFPKPTSANVGFEKQTLGSCADNNCEDVETKRLDVMMTDQQLNGKRVNVLLIDVEGYDYDVLLGGNGTLHHTEYVEFEFNWRGKWGVYFKQGKRPLKSVIDYMNDIGFTCYWAGRSELWRITDCWQPHYDGSFWSNVACAHRQLAPVLLERMETLFLKTIEISLIAKPSINETYFQEHMLHRYDAISLLSKEGDTLYKLLIVDRSLDGRSILHATCVWADPPAQEKFGREKLQALAKKMKCVRIIAVQQQPHGVSSAILEQELIQSIKVLSQSGVYIPTTTRRVGKNPTAIHFIYNQTIR